MDPSVILAWIKMHPYMAAATFGYWVFSNLVLRLPPVTAQSSGLYKSTFSILHFVAGAMPRIASNGLLPPWLAKLLAGGNGAIVNTPPSSPKA